MNSDQMLHDALTDYGLHCYNVLNIFKASTF